MQLDTQPGVYRISNCLSGKFYIGSSKDIIRRWDQHVYQATTARPAKRSHLYAAMRRYGLENFLCELIEPCAPVRSILLEREQHYIDTLKPDYNMQQKAGNYIRKTVTPPAPILRKWRLVGPAPVKPRGWSGILPIGIDGTIL